MTPSDAVFTRRCFIVLGVVALAALTIVLADLLLLIFSSIIIAFLLRATADLIRRVIPMGEAIAVLPAALLILAIVAATLLMFGTQMAQQVSEIIQRIPAAWDNLSTRFADAPWAQQLVEQFKGASAYLGEAAAAAPAYALGLAGAVANLGLALVGGVMLALDPRSYRDGALLLIPPSSRPSVRRAVNASGRALYGWLLGQLVSMLVIGVLTGVGLALVGLPSALGLGLFAGLAQFVPVVGPIVSAVPGLLIAATTDWNTLAWTAAVYVGVQQIEGNVITPFVQKHFAGLPMALALFSIVAFGVLFGPMGVLLATPLALVALVMVRSLYLRDVLGEDVPIPGEKEDAPARRAAAERQKPET